MTSEEALSVYVGVQATSRDEPEKVLLGYFDMEGNYKAISLPANKAKLYAVMMIQCANTIEGEEEDA